jgi:hypothetical protein
MLNTMHIRIVVAMMLVIGLLALCLSTVQGKERKKPVEKVKVLTEEDLLTHTKKVKPLLFAESLQPIPVVSVDTRPLPPVIPFTVMASVNPPLPKVVRHSHTNFAMWLGIAIACVIAGTFTGIRLKQKGKQREHSDIESPRTSKPGYFGSIRACMRRHANVSSTDVQQDSRGRDQQPHPDQSLSWLLRRSSERDRHGTDLGTLRPRHPHDSPLALIARSIRAEGASTDNGGPRRSGPSNTPDWVRSAGR